MRTNFRFYHSRMQYWRGSSSCFAFLALRTEVDVAFCRGQGFDGVSSMSSSSVGVQGRICQISPLALYMYILIVKAINYTFVLLSPAHFQLLEMLVVSFLKLLNSLIILQSDSISFSTSLNQFHLIMRKN